MLVYSEFQTVGSTTLKATSSIYSTL